MLPPSEIIPYENNPRKNENAVEVVAKSIKEFGFKQPIIIDKDNVIVAGHTRLKAAMKLGLKEVPVIWADDLTEEQVKAFRIMDNKSSEYATWDYESLRREIVDLKELKYDIDLTGFRVDEINFLEHGENPEGNNAYQEWRKSGDIDYDNENQNGHKVITLHFASEEAIAEFSRLVKQPITRKTKYLWFPKQAEDNIANLKYEEY